MAARTAFLLGCLLLLAVSSTNGDSPRVNEVPLSFIEHWEPPLGMDRPPRHSAGFFDLTRTTAAARMFYWFFESRTMKPDDPLVLWLTGGPGCGSEVAVFYENGPYRILDDLSLEVNENGWDNNHNMIFVDQPINTGFSYSSDAKDRVYDEKTVAEDLVEFMQHFLQEHPEFVGREFYITGESFAGHYGPAVASHIYHCAKAGTLTGVNLRGLAMGNPLVEPSYLYGGYAEYALKKGLVSQSEHDAMQNSLPACQNGIADCQELGGEHCTRAVTECVGGQMRPVLRHNPYLNIYDVRAPCKVHPNCYDGSLMVQLLRRSDVRAQLGVGEQQFSECSQQVHQDMMNDWLLGYSSLLPEMLANGIRMMVYVGEEDLMCNWVGNARWVDALQWTGSAAWRAAATRDWSVDGQAAGSSRAVPELWFVKVKGAGHQVPRDQPRNALDMITRFTRNQTLALNDDAPLALQLDVSSHVQHAEEQPATLSSVHLWKPTVQDA